MSFKQASSLGTQHSPQGNFNPHKVPPSQQDSEATRHITASDSTTGAEPPLNSQRPQAPQTPYSSDHINLRRTEITRLYARLYAAGPMMQFLLALGSGHGGGRLAAAALPPAAGRPRGAGPRAGTGLRALLRGDFGCSSRNSRTYFPS